VNRLWSIESGFFVKAINGADQVDAAPVFVGSKMICRAGCRGYNWVTKGPPLRDWAKWFYGDEWVLG